MSIASKLLQAQISVQAAEKNARNEHHSFNYAAADAVTALAKDALNAAGLVLVHTGWFTKPETLTICGTFWLFDSESEEKIELTAELPYVPGKGRPEDKAALASLTEMRGYLAIGLLGIERVEPLDISGRDDTQRDDRYQSAPRQQAPQQQQRPPQQNNGGDDLGTCKDCGSEMRMGRNGKPYCHPCYLEWKSQRESNAPEHNQQDRVRSGNGQHY